MVTVFVGIEESVNGMLSDALDRVRPEYVKLAHGFPALAASFGCAIPAAAQRDLVDFTMALECIDR